MKDRVVRAVFAAAVVAGCGSVFATDYTWRGGGADSNWSTAENWSPNGVPANVDTVIFDAQSTGTSYIDPDFGTGVMKLTLAENFSGKIVQQRDFIVYHTYTQRSGTFTCGENVFQVGNKGANVSSVGTLGEYFLYGGTFNGPVDAELRWWASQSTTARNFHVADAAAVDLTRTRLYVFLHGSGCNVKMHLCNRTIGSVETFTTSTKSNTGNVAIKLMGTNTVTGTFIFGSGVFSPYDSAVAYGTGCFDLKGDLIVTNSPYGGAHGGYFRLTGADDQRIISHIATNETYTVPGIVVDKPSGKLTIKGGRLSRSSGGYAANYGFEFLSGDVDMSELKCLTLTCYNTTFKVRDEVKVVWPARVEIGSYSCVFRMRNQVFNDLRINSSDSRINACFATTNTVTGWLEDYSFGFNGTSDTSWYPELTDKSKPPVLLVRGPGVNIITNKTNTYNGNYSQSGGYGVLVFDSAEDQVIIGGDSRVYLPSLEVQKPVGKSLTVDTVGGRLGLRAIGNGVSGANFKVMSGTVYGPTNRMDVSSYGSRFVEGPAGTYVCRGAVLNFTSWDGGTELRSPVAGIICNLSDIPGMGGNGLTVVKGTVLTVTNSFKGVAGNLKSGGTGARMDLSGDFATTGKNFGASSPNCPIRFVGDHDQHVSIIEDGTNTTGQITVAKTGGKLVLDTDVKLVKGTPALVHESGQVDVNGHRVTTKGEIVLHGGATLGVPAAPEVNELPWVATTGQLTEKNATAANPFVVHLTNARSYFDGPTLTGRVNVFGYGSFEKNTTHDPKRFTATASCGVSKRSKVLDDAEDKILYLNYRINEGTQVFVR